MSTANTIGIDPAALFAIRDLELRARVVVEGLWSGLHRSPLEGFSVEFTEYRNYSPGDDLRYLDWKVLGRTDQEFIKKFEDETNLRCMILVDTSRSMKFASGEVSKAEYARTLAATLGYFLLQQRDVVGLGLIDRDLHQFLPARWRPGQFKRLLSLLSMESEGKETNLGNGLDQIGKLTPKRSLVMVISDFLSPPEEWEKSLGQLIAAESQSAAFLNFHLVLRTGYGNPVHFADVAASVLAKHSHHCVIGNQKPEHADADHHNQQALSVSNLLNH